MTDFTLKFIEITKMLLLWHFSLVIYSKIFTHYVSVDSCNIYFIHTNTMLVSETFHPVLCLVVFKSGILMFSGVWKPLWVWKRSSWSVWCDHWDVWLLLLQLMRLCLSKPQSYSQQSTDDFFLQYNCIPPGWLMINSHIWKEFAIFHREDSKWRLGNTK